MLANEIAVSNCELIVPGNTLESGAIQASLIEMRERLCLGEDILLIEPTAAFTRARDGLESAGGS